MTLLPRFRTKRLTVGIAAALVSFVTAGVGAAVAMGALSSGAPVVVQSLSGTTQTAPVYAKNAIGQTYGSLLESTSPATEPTLARVIATNGQTGYVYTAQLDQSPSSPTAAIVQQEANTRGTYIPVYESDGTTAIGQFEVTEPVAQASASPSGS